MRPEILLISSQEEIMADTDLKEDPKSITIDCLEVKQPIGTFYACSIPWRDLCDIANFDVRRVIQEERDVERYLGIQRPLNTSRVKELEEYVTYFDATFPSSIIIAVDAKCADYDPQTKRMTLSNFIGNDEEKAIKFRHIARVLDGQHRIAGLYNYNGENFDVSVSLFVGADIADQAQIFSTVNLEQTKVNKSLAYDLFALAKSRSPQKTCHNVAIALDKDPESPFFRSIKRLGVATDGRVGETITQANFVESLMRYISRTPKKDRDILLRGGKLPPENADVLEIMPLRNLFISGKDMDIADLIWAYFDAIRKRWPEAWAFRGQGLMLNKTNGFRAAMRVFGPAYLHLAVPGDHVRSDAFLDLFARSNLNDRDFTTDRFVPGTGGEAELRRTWMAELGLQ